MRPQPPMHKRLFPPSPRPPLQPLPPPTAPRLNIEVSIRNLKSRPTKAASIPDTELLANMHPTPDLIHQRHRIILIGDLTLPIPINDHVLATKPVLPRPLARPHQHRRTKI